MAARKSGGGSFSTSAERGTTSSGSSGGGGGGGFKSLLPNARLFKAIGLGIALIVLPMVCFNSNFKISKESEAPDKSSEKKPPANVTVIYPGEGRVAILTGTIYKIKLDSVQWSPWLCGIPGTKVDVQTPGWAQYWWWTKSEPEPISPDGSVSWSGKIPSNAFRVRGEAGEAMIYLEYE